MQSPKALLVYCRSNDFSVLQIQSSNCGCVLRHLIGNISKLVRCFFGKGFHKGLPALQRLQLERLSIALAH